MMGLKQALDNRVKPFCNSKENHCKAPQDKNPNIEKRLSLSPVSKQLLHSLIIYDHYFTIRQQLACCFSSPSQRKRTAPLYELYSHEHYHNCFITLRKLQKRTGDPFSLKAQRKRSPCPIKRGTLKPSMLLATVPLILPRSLWQEKTFR